MKSRMFKGFTLVEMMVSVSIISVVAALSMTGLSRARVHLRASQCLSNQKQISAALQMFYNDHHTFPSDADAATLRESLVDYIKADKVFKCPCDLDEASHDSYADYYVRRTEEDGQMLFALGCPRHRDGSRTAALFQNGSASLLSLGRVEIQGTEMALSSSEDQRTVTSGQMSFEDASTAQVLNAGDGFGLIVINSCRLADGTLYTVLRVKGDGTIDCTVTPGSKFEVVTPSAIVAVRGTRFTVTTSDGGMHTQVTVVHGTVAVQDRVAQHSALLSAGQSFTAVNSLPACVRSRFCRAEHCNRCPMSPAYGDGTGDGDEGDDDGNNGHGNDPGGNDPSNPGRGGGRGGGHGGDDDD